MPLAEGEIVSVRFPHKHLLPPEPGAFLSGRLGRTSGLAPRCLFTSLASITSLPPRSAYTSPGRTTSLPPVGFSTTLIPAGIAGRIQQPRVPGLPELCQGIAQTLPAEMDILFPTRSNRVASWLAKRAIWLIGLVHGWQQNFCIALELLFVHGRTHPQDH